MSKEDFIICELPNGRRYKVFDSKTPYKGGEYPSGGFVIWTELKGKWYFVSHSPDLECLHNFLNAAKRSAPAERQTHKEKAKELWENFIDLLNKEDPLFFDKEKKEQSPHKSFLGSIEKYKTLFLRANSGG